MKEVKGNIWYYWDKKNTFIVIPTNGYVKRNGQAVMGRGCALQAVQRVPHLPRYLGRLIEEYGNKVFQTAMGIVSFPVKHNWWEKADLTLIEESCKRLVDLSTLPGFKDSTFVMPRVGCGNGKLDWEDVKPILEKYLGERFLIVHKKGG